MATATTTRTATNGNGHKNRLQRPETIAEELNATLTAPALAPVDAADLALRVTVWELKRRAAKDAYEEADRIEGELIRLLGVGNSLKLPDGRTLTINDNFLDRHGQPKVKAWSVCGIKRHEAEVK